MDTTSKSTPHPDHSPPLSTATNAPSQGPTRAFVILSLFLVLAFSTLDMFIAPLGIPITLILIAFLLKRGQEPWSRIGLRRPRRWWTVILGCLIGAIALQGATIFLILPLLGRLGLPLPDLASFAAIEGNPTMLAVFLLVSWTTAGFGEEVIWRGFLTTRLFHLFGDGPLGWGLALLLSSVGFGLLHAYQGVTGIFLTGFAGLVFGLVFLFSKRQLWPCILLHALTDTVSMLILYTGVWRQWME